MINQFIVIVVVLIPAAILVCYLLSGGSSSSDFTDSPPMNKSQTSSTLVNSGKVRLYWGVGGGPATTVWNAGLHQVS